MVRKKINKYIKSWEARGYPNGITDDAPEYLIKKNLAPCYKGICLALLNNDFQLISLGLTPKKSQWYGFIKKEEIRIRNETPLANKT